MSRLIAGVAVGALLATTSACSGSAGPGTKSPAGTEHGLLGGPAPDFSLSTPSGQRVQLGDAKGKVAIVDFWATWCKPCKESFPVYQRFAEQYPDELLVIGVSVDEGSDGIGAFATETGARFPLVWDESQEVAKSYSPPSMPTSYLIDRQGIVRLVHAGFRPGDEEILAKELAKLTAE